MPAQNLVESRYYTGQGALLIAERDATTGAAKGYTHVGNCPELKMSVAVSVDEHKESTTGQSGIDKRRTKETKVTVSAIIESLNKENLARALRGTAAAVAAGTATDEPVIAYLGKTVALAHVKVSSVVVKSDDATPVTYEVDKNYTVNPEAGSINILTTAEQTTLGAVANIADEDNLEISYSYAAQETVDAMTEGAKDYRLRFEGMNTSEDNKAVVVEVFKFSSDPLKELSLIGDSWGQIALEGAAQLDLTRTTGSKFFREIMEA